MTTAQQPSAAVPATAPTWPAYVQLASSMILVGASVILGKLVVEHVPVALTAGLRFFVAVLVLAPLARVYGGLRPRLDAGAWATLALQAFFGVFLFNLLILEGVQRTSALSVGLITSALPAAIALGAWALLRERPGVRLWTSVALAVLGIAAVNAASADFAGAASIIGNALVLGAVVAEALFSILAKRLSGRIAPAAMAFWVNLIGLALFAPLAVPQAAALDWGAVPPSIWVIALIYSVSAGVLSFVLWYAGVARVPGAVAGVFTGFAPLTTAVLAIVLLGERGSVGSALGAAALFASLAIATWPGAGRRGEP